MPEHWMTSGKRRLRVKEGSSFAHRAQARAAFMGYLPNKRNRTEKGPRNIQHNHPRFYKRTAVQDLGSHWSCPIARRGIVAVGGPRRQAQTPASEENDMATAKARSSDPAAAPRRRIRNANASNHFFSQNSARVATPVPPPVQYYGNPMQGIRPTTRRHRQHELSIRKQPPMHPPPMPQAPSYAHQHPSYPRQASYPTVPNQPYPHYTPGQKSNRPFSRAHLSVAEMEYDFESYGPIDPTDAYVDPETGFEEFDASDEAYEDSFYDDDQSTIPSPTRMPPPSHRPAYKLFQRKQKHPGPFTNRVSLGSTSRYGLEGTSHFEADCTGLASPPWAHHSNKPPLFGNRANAFSSHQLESLAQPRQANIFPTHQSTAHRPLSGLSSLPSEYAEPQEYSENHGQIPTEIHTPFPVSRGPTAAMPSQIPKENHSPFAASPGSAAKEIPKEIHTPFAASRDITAKPSFGSPLSESHASAIDGGINEAADILLPELGDDEGHGPSPPWNGWDLANDVRYA